MIISGSSSESEISTSVAPGTWLTKSANCRAYCFSCAISLPRRPTCTGRLSPRPPPWLDTTVTLRPSTFLKSPRSSSIICCMLRSRSLEGFSLTSMDPWLTGLRPLPILRAAMRTSGKEEIFSCSGVANATVFSILVPIGALKLTLNSPES